MLVDFPKQFKIKMNKVKSGVYFLHFVLTDIRTYVLEMVFYIFPPPAKADLLLVPLERRPLHLPVPADFSFSSTT